MKGLLLVCHNCGEKIATDVLEVSSFLPRQWCFCAISAEFIILKFRAIGQLLVGGLLDGVFA